MRIYLQEITDLEKELSFDEATPWVAQAVSKVDETLEERAAGAPAQTRQRKTDSSFSLRKVDDVVVITGSVDTQVQLACSRCVTSYAFDIHLNFTSLYCKDPVMAGVGHLGKPEGRWGKSDDDAELKPMGINQGHARHAHDFAADAAGTQDLDITYIAEDYVDLSDVLTEQLQLTVPFQPLCKEDCKGLCANCGADLNVGRCACSKLNKASPFSSLKNLKV
jgi:uncharacterized protein